MIAPVGITTSLNTTDRQNLVHPATTLCAYAKQRSLVLYQMLGNSQKGDREAKALGDNDWDAY